MLIVRPHFIGDEVTLLLDQPGQNAYGSKEVNYI